MAAELSAYQICLHIVSSFLIMGMVAKPYMGIARGSPCVVPSWDKMTSPSTSRSVGLLYELMSMVTMERQRRLMLCSATWRLSVLKAFVASTSSMASFSSSSKADLSHEQLPQRQRSGLHTSDDILLFPGHLKRQWLKRP